ncbi:hypothetical protein [Salinimicrobium gaetbulicola]|uniref:Uncharacterized protein n=1 Tax=Salinimicrobium gaetbulicola TaxID=999702 RepID=A0ABW3IH63_9FLAO
MKISFLNASHYLLIFLFLPFVFISCKQDSEVRDTAFKVEKVDSQNSVVGNETFFEVREDTHVLVTVDTENISEETKNENVFITDDRSDPSQNSEKPGEHIALVDKNQKIYWRGEPKDPSANVSVDIVEIRRKADGGAEILEAVFRDPNKDGIIIGKIKNKKVSGLEYYNIVIRINGESTQTFVIDPKIQMSGN